MYPDLGSDCTHFDLPEVANRCRELYYCFSDPASPRARFTNATTGILAIIDVQIRFASHPKAPEDQTRESARESISTATSLEMESRNRENLEVMQQLGISDSTSILELLNLAGQYGILEAQPPRENGVPLSSEPKRTLSSDHPNLSALGAQVVQR